MVCDCGYSFHTGEPPRHAAPQLRAGSSDAASRVATRLVIRLVGVGISLGLLLAIRTCSS